MDLLSPSFLQVQGVALIAIGSAAALSRWGGRRGVFQASTAGLVAGLAFGQFHEILDLAGNPLSLPAPALRGECAGDMALNLAGAAAGCLLWAAVAGALVIGRGLRRKNRGLSLISQ
jgi:hypothetical protein